jgi:NitT/TauT family transport system substrate-binding protein
MKARMCRKRFIKAQMAILAVLFVLAVGFPAPGGAADEVSLRLDWKIYGTHAPFFMAAKKGFYRAGGMKVKIGEGTGSSSVVKLMGAKNDTFAFAAGVSTLQGVTKGIPVKSVFGIMQKSPLAIMSLTKSNLKTPKDLLGKSVSTSGKGSGTALFAAFLKTNQVNPCKVTLAALGRSGKSRALLAGKVAGMIGYSVTEVPSLEGKGARVRAMHLGDWGMNVVANGIIINTETEKTNPKLIRRFLKAVKKGIVYAKAHPKESADFLKERFPHKKRAVLGKELKWTFSLLASKATEGKPLGWQADSDWARTQSVLKKNNLIKKTMPLRNYFTNAYIP